MSREIILFLPGSSNQHGEYLVVKERDMYRYNAFKQYEQLKRDYQYDLSIKKKIGIKLNLLELNIKTVNKNCDTQSYN